MKSIFVVYLTAAIISVLFASSVLWVACIHNPQQEFYGSELGVNWAGLIVLWIASFGLIFITLCLVVWLILKIMAKMAS